ncbi:MAG: LTA synthase family protein [Candidatus Binatia bacterium]
MTTSRFLLSTRSHSIHRGLSIVFGVSLAISFTSYFVVDFLDGWSQWLIAVILLGAVTISLAHSILKGWARQLMAIPMSTHAVFLVLSLALATLFAAVRSDQGLSAVWIKAAGGLVGQEAPVSDRLAWGKHYSAFELHAAVNNDRQWMWRAHAEIPEVVRIFGGTLTLLITQPEWAVFDKERRVYQGGDGVELQFLVDGGNATDTVGRVNLNLHARLDHRLWQRVKVPIPAGSRRLMAEALPGPPGSNNWNDRVFVGVEDIRSSLATISRPADSVLLALVLYIFGLALYSAVGRLTRLLPVGPLARTLSYSAVLWLFLVAVRAVSVALAGESEVDIFSGASIVMLSGSYDLLYVGALTGTFAALLCLFRRGVKAQRMLYGLFAVTALLSLSAGILNVKASHALGGPFNYQWLYYSEFLAGHTARTSLFAYVSWTLLVVLLATNLAFLAVASPLSRSLGRRAQQKPELAFSVAAILYVGIYLSSAVWSGTERDYDKVRLANPVVSFVESMVTSARGPKLFTMATSAGTEDFQPAAGRMPETALGVGARRLGIRNVIIFVLESVAADYVYGENAIPSGVIPEIKKYQRHAAVFENIYAHAPASNKSLVSMLCSVYPLISYKSLTQENPHARLTSISAILKQQGYRTGFFASGDTRFQRGDEFLSHQRFDLMVSYKNLRCEKKSFTYSNTEWPFQNSYDDECILEPFTTWAGNQDRRAFFAVLWPVQTHQPYSIAGRENKFAVASEAFNRYLNALRHTDRILGELLAWLESRQLLESTIVVVVGDHGEAFGQHGQWTHASHIYEENVRVPLLLINRRLFNAQKYEKIGGLIDIAPTIMELLQIPPADTWQGRSLFSPDRGQRTYFFAPYTRFLFGLRDENLKLILDGGSNNYEVYDLQGDPKEKTNLARKMPEFVRQGEQRLAAWVQYQNRFFDKVLGKKPAGRKAES